MFARTKYKGTKFAPVIEKVSNLEQISGQQCLFWSQINFKPGAKFSNLELSMWFSQMCKVFIKKSKISAKIEIFLTWATPNSTLEGAKGYFEYQNRVLRLKKPPTRFLDREVIIKESKIGKKGDFLTQFAPNPTLYGARGKIWPKNLVLRVKWTHKVFYFDRLRWSWHEL